MFEIILRNHENVKSRINVERYISYITKLLSKKDRKLDYTELHHILPACIFKEYKNLRTNSWNKIRLTAREHYIAHWILAKAFGGKLVYAFNMMHVVGNSHQRKYTNSRAYHQNRKRLTMELKNISEKSKMERGEKISKTKQNATTIDENGNTVKISRIALFKAHETRRNSMVTHNGVEMSIQDRSKSKLSLSMSRVVNECTQETLAHENAKKAANTRMTKNVVVDGESMSMAEYASLKAANTRMTKNVVVDGESMSMAEYASLKAAETSMTTLVEFEGKMIPKSKMVAILAARKRKTTMIEFEGNVVSMQERTNILISRKRKKVI